MLTVKEKLRYNRQIILPELGEEGQHKLKKAKVLVIGAGGLGCPALYYLSAAGVGNIGVIDDDTVDVSNLHRQIMYNESDIGKEKALCVKEKITQFNPNTEVNVYPKKLSIDNALHLIKHYDIVLDGSDNFATRYLVNDACVILKKPFVYGAVFQFNGQVSVFNFKGGPTYRCLFPEPPTEGTMPSCSEAGVIGVLPGIIGSYQASEVIKLITGIGKPLSGQLFMIDLRTNFSQTIKFKLTPKNLEIKKLKENYSIQSCDLERALLEITPFELKSWLNEEKNIIQLIDVREKEEFEAYNIGGVNIPLSKLDQNIKQVLPSKKIVICCQSGTRSKLAQARLTKTFPKTEIYNLSGGINSFIG